MIRHLMSTFEARRYLAQQHGITRSCRQIQKWLRTGRVLPVTTIQDGRGFVRLTTAGQIDAAVDAGLVPPRGGKELPDRQVMVHLMDEFGGTLAED